MHVNVNVHILNKLHVHNVYICNYISLGVMGSTDYKLTLRWRVKIIIDKLF